MAIEFQYHDGGRRAAGYKGETDDCVVRALAIATGRPYKEVYRELAQDMKTITGKASCRNGVLQIVYHHFLERHGFQKVQTIFKGSSERVHLCREELPKRGVVVCEVSKHVATVVDGVLYDTFDCSRDGTRLVYRYWTK